MYFLHVFSRSFTMSLALPVAALAAVLAVGCGGGSGGESTATSAAAGSTRSSSEGEGASPPGHEKREAAAPPTKKEAAPPSRGGKSTSPPSRGQSTSPPPRKEATGPAGSEAPPSSSRKAFVKRANAICTRGAKQVYRALGKARTGSDAATEAAVAAFLKMIRRVEGEIRQLGAPPGDEAQVEAVVTSMRGAVETAEERHVSSLEELAQLLHRADAQANSYGLHACVFG